MANPSDMTDEELQTVIETGVEPDEPESPQEAPEEVAPEVKEEPEVTPPEEEQKEEPKEEPEKETPEESEKQPSRRETLRIQQLLAKYGNPDKGPEPLKAKPTIESLDYSQALDADPEVIKQLETDRQARSDAAYLEGIRQGEVREWRRDLKYENNTVLDKYKFLNPKDSEHFKPAAAEAMNTKYLRFVGYNPGDAQWGIPESVQHPDVSYLEFVESEMEFVDELASQKVAETTKNIAKQAATTGLRPDGSSAKRLNLNQAPQSMNLDELYAAIGQKRPK